MTVLKQRFSKLSEAKMQQGVFVDPDVGKLTEDSSFTSTLNSTENQAQNAFIDVTKIFLVITNPLIFTTK